MAEAQHNPDMPMGEDDDGIASFPEPLVSNLLRAVSSDKRARLIDQRNEQTAIEAHQEALYDVWVWTEIVLHKLEAEEFLLQTEGYGPMTQLLQMFNESPVPRDAPQIQALAARLGRIQESLDGAHSVAGSMQKGYEAKVIAQRQHPLYSMLVEASETAGGKDQVGQLADSQLREQQYSLVEALEGYFSAEAKLVVNPMPAPTPTYKTPAEAAYERIVNIMTTFLKNHGQSE